LDQHDAGSKTKTKIDAYAEATTIHFGPLT
jgi:hypothetical protein